MTTLGFIGLGHMGLPMAKNFLKAGFDVYVYDVNPAAYTALSIAGAKPVERVKDCAKVADVLVTSVQTGEQVTAICLGEEGIFAHGKSGLLFIDCSSIDLTVTRYLHSEAQKFRINMVDAPVSGGVKSAEAGTLTVMVGGQEDSFLRAKPILEKIGKTIIYAGAAGSGQAAKICNNLLLGISMIGVSEAFILAKNLGLDPKKFFDISSQASGQCWSMTSYCPYPNIIPDVPSNHHYQPGFMAKMMLKDLHLGTQAAASVQSAIPLGALAMELYELYVNQGHGDLDFSSIINLISDREKH